MYIIPMSLFRPLRWAFRSRPLRGVTLIELMIAMAILSFSVLVLIGAFGNMARVIRVSKAKTIANNLAQEKIETLKNLSYHRLLVTTSPVTSDEPGITPFVYDEGYYPTETLAVGQIQFLRRVYIEKVNEDAGVITPQSWWQEDTGLKRITSYVLWQENDEWRILSIANIRDNINRQPLDSTITGIVLDGFTPVLDAKVLAVQNGQYTDLTDATGNYEFSVAAGTYTLRAIKHGYFTQTVNDVYVAASSTTVQHFFLNAMGSGNIKGIAFLNNHLVLSKFCVAAGGDDKLEYVQIYNPTSSTYVIDSGGSNPSYTVRFVKASDGSVTVLNPPGETIYANTSIPPDGFFLIASSVTVNGVAADAYYSDSSLVTNVPADRILKEEEGGLALESRGVYEVAGTTVDAIGWGRGSSPYGHALAREGNGFLLPGGPGYDGLITDEYLERVAYSTSTAALMNEASAGGHSNDGNAYDSNVNASDWVYNNDVANNIPHNSADAETAKTGTPAVDGLVFVDDGLSASGKVLDTPTPGYFYVTDVATGSWLVLISSSGYSYSNSGVTVTDGSTVDLGQIHIATPATQGFATGRVVDGSANGVPNIQVSATVFSDITDSNGYFRLQLDVATYTVTANPDNIDSSYTSDVATGVVVTAGSLTVIPDFEIFLGGIVEGFVTTNGTDPLPGIPVLATVTASGAYIGSDVSDSFGYFRFYNLPVDNYTFSPQLEVGESANPGSLTKTVVSGDTVFAGSFTVTNAFGTLSGTVKKTNGDSITTGVLIMAVDSSVPIGSDPPPITSGIRNGSTYYYFATSDSDGKYSLALRGGITYNVAAWYTTFSGETPNSDKKTGSVAMSVGGDASMDFTW